MSISRLDRLEFESAAVRFGDLLDILGPVTQLGVSKWQRVPPRVGPWVRVGWLNDLPSRAAAILTARVACSQPGLPQPDRWPDTDAELRHYAGAAHALAA